MSGAPCHPQDLSTLVLTEGHVGWGQSFTRGRDCNEDITLNLCALTMALTLMVTRPITKLEQTERAVFPGTPPRWCRKSPRETVNWGWSLQLSRTKWRPPGPLELCARPQMSASSDNNQFSCMDSAYLLSSLPALPRESIQASLPLAREGNEEISNRWTSPWSMS